MSDSRTWVNIGGAIIGGVLAYFTFGASAILTGAALGYAAAGFIQGPASPKNGAMRPDEFQVVQSSESATIPVIFGTVRIAGNFLCYDKASFVAEEIHAEEEGGKGGGGGGEQVVGYSYSMTWVTGLCMGPIDALVKIQGSPGMDEIEYHQIDEDNDEKADILNAELDRDKFLKWLEKFYTNQEAAPEGPIDMTAGLGIKISMKGTKDDSGHVWLDPGSRTQVGHVPLNGETMNFRDIVIASFDKFTMGTSPAPRTYLFTLMRLPKVVDDDGVPIEGFPVNAATDPEMPEYGDANPAAILWELMQNKVWGKGVSASKMNVEDFKKAANYYRNNRLGISTSLGDDQSNVELTQRFRDLFGFATWDENGTLRCRALWDRTDAYSPRIRITPEDIIGEPAITRQSMLAATNEIRMTFSNRENNWQEEAVTAQDLASIEQLGAARSLKIDASEVGTRRCAELIAHRKLRDLAYPLAVCNVILRRTLSRLNPGAFVEMVVDGWRGDAMTTFWRVESVDDDDTGEGRFSVVLVEDAYATGTDGEITDFTAPIPSIDIDSPLTNDDLVTIDYSQKMPVGDILPALIDEPNIWITKNERRVLLAVQRRSGILQSVGVGFREAAVGNYINAGVFQSFAITGELVDAVGAGGPKIAREAANQFRLTLNHEPDASRLLSAASAVQADGDGFDILTGTNGAIMVIGLEVFRIGWIEETGENEFTVRTFMRSEYGTDAAAHAIGDTFFFFPIFSRERQTMLTPNLPVGLTVEIGLNPYSVNGYAEPVYLTGPDAGTFSGRSIKPLRPELVSATRVGTVWTVKVRPRIYNGGAGYGPNLGAELAAREADVGLHRVRIAKSSSDLVTLPDYFASGSVGSPTMAATSFTWTAPNGNDSSGGIWTVVVSFDTNPANLTLYALLGGYTSDPLVIPQPPI